MNNTLEIKNMMIPSGYETRVFVIDGKPLYEYLTEWLGGNVESLRAPDMLEITWTDKYDFEGDARFMRYVLAQNSAITPILSCPDDFNFTCIVVVADVVRQGDQVIWKRIGKVDHSKELLKEEIKHGILYLQTYTEEDWEKYGDNIALEEVNSPAWREWTSRNWGEELFRRRVNYTFPYYQNEENIIWIADCNFRFSKDEYNKLIESCYNG